jgi:hypothetical protein
MEFVFDPGFRVVVNVLGGGLFNETKGFAVNGV